MDISKIPLRIINLDIRPDRYKAFTSVDTGFSDIERFPAVYGKNEKDFKDVTEMTKLKIASNIRRSHEDVDSAGAWGCSQSHINLWKWFLSTDHEMLFVGEDDLAMDKFQEPKSLLKFVQSQYEKLPSYSKTTGDSGWDVWLVGFTALRDCKDWKLPDPTPVLSGVVTTPGMRCSIKDKLVDVRSFFGTHAYIVTRQGAKTLLDNAFPIEAQMDGYIGIEAQLGKLRIIANPQYTNYLLHSDAGTDIGHASRSLCMLSKGDHVYKILFYIIMVIIFIIFICLWIELFSGNSVFGMIDRKLQWVYTVKT